MPILDLRACTRTQVLVVGLACAAAGCSSSGQLRDLKQQLDQVQGELSQLREESPKRAQVEELAASSAEETTRILGAQTGLALKVDEIEQRVEEVLASLRDNSRALVDLTERTAAVQTHLDTVTASLEQLLNVRKPTPPAVAETDPDQLYRVAYDHFLKGEYEEALTRFQRFVESFVNNEQADDAQYWIGECHYSQHHYPEAITAFDLTARRYPNSDRLASALLRKGFAFLQLGDTKAGRDVLETVASTFPNSDEAVLAKNQLATLGS